MIGNPRRGYDTYYEYEIENCNVHIDYDKQNTVTALEIELNNKYNFDLSKFNLTLDYNNEPTYTNNIIFGKLQNILGNGMYTHTCILSGCGTIHKETGMYLSYEGSHARNFINVEAYSKDIEGNITSMVINKWRDTLMNDPRYDDRYNINNGNYILATKYNDLANTLFYDIKIDRLKIGFLN